eukprot:TRINITY_DN2261_c0_g1_i4.p1 TRINITY_DN2261_c0_g1~~TRINITY_DN2261_c0_g1_i4.p1  ORF type:complete len:273 (+),score=53.04 TRINITY_DN2261_c0_g1_i4:720-1538(+)
MPPPPPVTSLLSTSGLQSTQKVLAVPQSDASLDSPIEKPLTVAVDTSKPLSTPRRLSFVVSASLSSSWTEARSFLTSSAKTPSGKPPSETSSVDNQPIADLQVENENSPGEIPISICDPNPMSEKVLMLVFSDEESSGDIYWDSWLDIEKFMSDVRAEAAERVKIGNSTYASNGFCQYLDWLGKGFEFPSQQRTLAGTLATCRVEQVGQSLADYGRFLKKYGFKPAIAKRNRFGGSWVAVQPPEFLNDDIEEFAAFAYIIKRLLAELTAGSL